MLCEFLDAFNRRTWLLIYRKKSPLNPIDFNFKISLVCKLSNPSFSVVFFFKDYAEIRVFHSLTKWLLVIIRIKCVLIMKCDENAYNCMYTWIHMTKWHCNIGIICSQWGIVYMKIYHRWKANKFNKKEFAIFFFSCLPRSLWDFYF